MFVAGSMQCPLLGQSLLHADAGISPTQWQASTYPPALRRMIDKGFAATDVAFINSYFGMLLILGTGLAIGPIIGSWVMNSISPVGLFIVTAQRQLQRGDATRAQFYVRRLNASPDLVNAESLWLGLRVERRLGNQDGVRQLAEQLRQRFPNSPEWAKYLRGAFDE